MDILDRIENINGIQLSMGSLSDYQIDESIGNKGRIGYGGFSTVYAMRRRGTLYAVKIPNQANIGDPESSIKFNPDENFVRAYIKEARIWAAVTAGAPGSAVRLIDFGVDPFPWMVMEYADGGSFKEAMDNGTATLWDVAGLLRSLQSIHDLDINHLDIKPENILSIKGKWKFSDFGMSKMVGSASVSVGIKGSGIYLAPEQCGGRGSQKDFTTDLWQVAVIVYQMVTGRLPYDSDPTDLSSLAVEIIMNGPRMDLVPEKFRPILSKAFNKDHSLRFSSASSFAEAIEAVIGEPEVRKAPKPVLSETPGPMFGKGMQFFKGLGSGPDYKAALDMFSLDGSVPSAVMSAIIFHDGLGVPKDTLRAAMIIRELGTLPEPADGDMKWAYGYISESGIGKQKNAEEAVRFYEESCSDNSCLGQFAMYKLRKDEDSMVGLLMAAEHGYAPAYLPVYRLYKERGENGIRYLMKSADSGDPDSELELGMCYETGDGVPVSGNDALIWYKKSAEHGNTEAMYRLGLLYESGTVADGSTEDSREWFEKAAGQGHPGAAARLNGSEDVSGDAGTDEDPGAPDIQFGSLKYKQIPGGVCVTGTYGEPESVEIPSSIPTEEGNVKVICIGKGAFRKSGNLAAVKIAGGVSRIESGAFANCKSLKTVILPSGLTEIRSNAFKNCISLTHIEIPEGVKNIDYSAFSHCFSLKSIVLPQSLDSIGRWAFEYCSSLQTLYFPDYLDLIGYSAFIGCNNLCSVSISKKTRYNYSVFPKKTKITVRNQ